MNRFRTIALSECKLLDRNKRIVIFGAGDRGKKYADFLLENGYSIEAFWDNDQSKQGKEIKHIKVISYEQLFLQSDYYLVLGSAYAAQETERISQLNCIEAIQFLNDDYAEEWIKRENKENKL